MIFVHGQGLGGLYETDQRFMGRSHMGSMTKKCRSPLVHIVNMENAGANMENADQVEGHPIGDQ